MSNVRVHTNLRDSGNEPISGWIEVTAANLFSGYGAIPKPLITRNPRRFFPNANGYVMMTLVDSATSGVTYNFKIGRTETVTIAPQPPNTTPEVIQRDVIYDEFNAMVPTPTAGGDALPVDLADLVPCNVSLASLDSTIGMIAEKIVSDPNLRMRANLFQFTGVFDPTRVYSYGQVVSDLSVGVRAFVCISERTLPGPLDSINWMRIT